MSRVKGFRLWVASGFLNGAAIGGGSTTALGAYGRWWPAAICTTLAIAGQVCATLAFALRGARV